MSTSASSHLCSFKSYENYLYGDYLLTPSILVSFSSLFCSSGLVNGAVWVHSFHFHSSNPEKSVILGLWRICSGHLSLSPPTLCYQTRERKEFPYVSTVSAFFKLPIYCREAAAKFTWEQIQQLHGLFLLSKVFRNTFPWSICNTRDSFQMSCHVGLVWNPGPGERRSFEKECLR